MNRSYMVIILSLLDLLILMLTSTLLDQMQLGLQKPTISVANDGIRTSLFGRHALHKP